MATMWAEIGKVLKNLKRDPGFALLAVLLFGLTLGATVGVFAVVDAVLLRPTAFASADRTVVMWERDTARNAPVVEVALGEVESWRRTQVFDDVAVFGSVNWTLTVIEGDLPSRLPYASVSAPFFSVVGVAPVIGRTLEARDETASAPSTAVISHRMWQQQFGGDPAVLGKVLRVVEGDLDAAAPVAAVEIVGVMPADFDFPRGAMLWLPAAPSVRVVASRDDPAFQSWYFDHFKVFYAIGRLRDGVSPTHAGRALSGVVRNRPDVPASAPSQVIVTAVEDYLVGTARPVLWVMLAGASLMILLACSSVASLQVFRASRNDHALAIQLALGASRAELVRRTLFESAVLATTGALAAGAVAWAVVVTLVALAPIDVPRLSTARVDSPATLAAIAGLVVVAAFLTALWPALFVTRVDIARTLTTGTRTALHPREQRLQRLVVAWQVAVAVIVLAGAGLFLRSVQRLDAVDLGFVPSGLLVATIEPFATSQERWDQFYDALIARARGLPGAEHVAAVYLRPLSGPIGMDVIPVKGDQPGFGPDALWRTNPLANLEAITPGYFTALGTPLIAGRDFSTEDRASSPGVVIVGASTASRLWPGQHPVGERIRIPAQRDPGTLEQPHWQTVVGVVDDVRYRGLTDQRLDVYMPAAQSKMRLKHLLIRTSADPSTLAEPLRAIVRELDSAARLEQLESMDEVVARESAPWRFATRVLSGFGFLAALLATVALMSLVSLVVTLRRRELGIRSALGATPRRLQWQVVSDALRVIVGGTVTGLLGAAAMGQMLKGLLVETAPTDLVSLAGAALLTVVAATVGCFGPAHRAAGREPLDAIRE